MKKLLAFIAPLLAIFKSKFDSSMTEEEFNSLPHEKKKVLVAKDVIKHLNSKKIIARQMSNVKFVGKKFNYYADPKGSIKEYMCSAPADDHDCAVCAKGGLFMSIIGRANKLQFEDVYFGTTVSSSVFNQVLYNIFGREQIDLIEIAFEGRSDFYWMGMVKPQDRLAAIEFNKNVLDPDKKLRAIMENIIKNNGEFRP